MTELHEASRALRRPKDEHFKDPQSLIQHLVIRESQTQAVAVADIKASINSPTNLGARINEDFHRLNDWSFSQFCRMSMAPPSFIRQLRVDTAATVLNETREDDLAEKRVALTLDAPDDETPNLLRALYSTKYTRLVDLDFAMSISEQTARFTQKGLYASDRDIFLFYIDENDRIDVEGEKLSRGFFGWNSEVGSKSAGYMIFLYNHICCNHIVWGAADIFKQRRRHVGDLSKFMKDMKRAIAELGDRGREKDSDVVRAAIHAIYAQDNEEAINKMRHPSIGLGKKQAESSLEFARQHNGPGANLSRWKVVQGITRLAQEIPHMDERVKLESKASKILVPA